MLEQVQKSHPAHQGSAQLAMLLAEDTRNAKRVFEIVDAALALNPPPLFYAMFLSARGGCHASLGDMYVYYSSYLFYILFMLIIILINFGFAFVLFYVRFCGSLFALKIYITYV